MSNSLGRPRRFEVAVERVWERVVGAITQSSRPNQSQTEPQNRERQQIERRRSLRAQRRVPAALFGRACVDSPSRLPQFACVLSSSLSSKASHRHHEVHAERAGPVINFEERSSTTTVSPGYGTTLPAADAPQSHANAEARTATTHYHYSTG